jgi:hypothetical protein
MEFQIASRLILDLLATKIGLLDGSRRPSFTINGEFGSDLRYFDVVMSECRRSRSAFVHARRVQVFFLKVLDGEPIHAVMRPGMNAIEDGLPKASM